jgi:ornithine carbamoyltransferase
VKHFLSIRDLAREDLPRLFALMAELKSKTKARDRSTPLPGRTMALIFEKPSLRTRVTFEVAMIQLGRRGVPGRPGDRDGKRESVPDVARNLPLGGRGGGARVLAPDPRAARRELVGPGHQRPPTSSTLPGDGRLFTLWERGVDPAKLRLGWVGDGNNVCNSLLLVGAMLGTTSVVACPPGYEPDAAVLEACRALGGRVQVTTEARDAVEDADVVYTDTWISMGQESDREQRLEAFQRYQLNDRLLGCPRQRWSCTACPPTAGRRSPTRCSTGRAA